MESTEGVWNAELTQEFLIIKHENKVISKVFITYTWYAHNSYQSVAPEKDGWNSSNETQKQDEEDREAGESLCKL